MSKVKGFQEGKNPEFSPGAKQTVCRLGKDHKPRNDYFTFSILAQTLNPRQWNRVDRRNCGTCKSRGGMQNDITTNMSPPRVWAETKTNIGNWWERQHGKTKANAVSYPTQQAVCYYIKWAALTDTSTHYTTPSYSSCRLNKDPV